MYKGILAKEIFLDIPFQVFTLCPVLQFQRLKKNTIRIELTHIVYHAFTQVAQMASVAQ